MAAEKQKQATDNVVPFPERAAENGKTEADPVISVRELENERTRQRTKIVITTSGFPLPPFGVPMNRVSNPLAA